MESIYDFFQLHYLNVQLPYFFNRENLLYERRMTWEKIFVVPQTVFSFVLLLCILVVVPKKVTHIINITCPHSSPFGTFGVANKAEKSKNTEGNVRKDEKL